MVKRQRNDAVVVTDFAQAPTSPEKRPRIFGPVDAVRVPGHVPVQRGAAAALESNMITPLLNDAYQFTMAYALWKNNLHNEANVFELYFRKNPFGGEFTIFAGLSEVLNFVERFQFTALEIADLRQTLPGGPYEDAFFVWLQTLDCKGVTIRALQEGSVCFPSVPMLQVEGPAAVTRLLETTLLNLVNFASLVATNAARMRLAVGDKKQLLEFGLRRAQGPDGAMSASRYARLGGCDGTSNVLAAAAYNIPLSGTMAHSFIMQFSSQAQLRAATLEHATRSGESADLAERVLYWRKTWLNARLFADTANAGELAAFTAYARAFPRSFLALVDTVNTLESGIPNFLCVAAALHDCGYEARGIRLDSGDLAYLSKQAREMFERAAKHTGANFFANFTIVASNDLNEAVIRSLNLQGHSIDVFAVGTNLVTCQAQPALGGVYKVVEVEGMPRIKLSEDSNKMSIPGRKDAYRLYSHEGHPLVDLLVPADAPPSERPIVGRKIRCVHPHDAHKKFDMIPSRVESLLQPVWPRQADVREDWLARARARCVEGLQSMRIDHLRPGTENPTAYKVSVTTQLLEIINRTRAEVQPVAVVR